MTTFNKNLLAAVLACGAVPLAVLASYPVSAQSAAPGLVAGKSLGRAYLGDTPAQVHKALGKPDKTLRLRNGLLDDIYRAKKTRMRTESETVRDKVEVLYRAGKVVQIEATSPVFQTTNGLSTSSAVSKLTRSNASWRVLVYGYDHPESGWQNYYLVDQKKGLTLEFQGWQEQLWRRSLPTTIIVHRAGTRPIPDVGGKLVTDSLDLSVVMSEQDTD